MSLRIRRLQIAMATQSGPFGVEVSFTDGLNVLAAPNTSGKSTCVMSILYALGLEGMLGPTQNPPLPDAMSRRLTHNEKEINVIESRVRLEVENHRKEFLTVDRLVTGLPQHRQLIRGVLGPALTAPTATYPRKDFYVRTSGAM
jgi:AAA domain